MLERKEPESDFCHQRSAIETFKAFSAVAVEDKTQERVGDWEGERERFLFEERLNLYKPNDM